VARYYIRAWVIATAEDGSTSATPLDRAAVGDSEDSPLLEAMSPVKGDGIPDHYIENHAEGLRILSPNGVIIAQEPKYFRVSDVSVVGKTSEALFYSGQIIENGTPLEIVRAIVFPR
jgi:hypothetical protein